MIHPATRFVLGAAIASVVGCSVERMPALRVVHHGAVSSPRRVVILPTECAAPWCAGIDAIVTSELAFRGVEVVELAKLPALERARTEVEVSSTTVIDGRATSAHQRTVTVSGPTYSEVDMWTQRAALGELGIEGLVRVRIAELATWPRRSFALVRITRASDAELIVASACELEVSRLDGDAEIAERAVRCALRGVTP
jgi:hypothetical protein